MQSVVASITRGQRLNVLLVGVFSGLALLLAAVGLYAVMRSRSPRASTNSASAPHSAHRLRGC